MKTQILYELASSKRTFWELLDKVNSPLKDFVAALKCLAENGLIAFDEDGFSLTDRGWSQIKPESLSFESKPCTLCQGKRIIPDAKFENVLAEFKRIASKRPSPSINFFQGYMLERDVVARVAMMHYYGDLSGKAIVLIGDDDLLSIALALTRLPSRITVLDIDKRLGEFIKSVNWEYGFNIEYVEYNVADPLPVGLRGKFDVFSSEPLETLSGLKAFLMRGVACLRENGAGYFGLTLHEASLKKWLAVQKFLSRMNCVVTDIIQGFSVYPMDYGTANYEEFACNLGFKVGKNPGINWYKSALYRFEVFGKAKLPANADKKLKIQFIDKKEDLTHPTLYRKLGNMVKGRF
ncbi:MAG: bis-aminopropyl spermidine synthase family protein [Candidatus Bathyarchaeota archaeon]|nr:bis-aminopropyl spermidine synthase family protein [Candidatus Bathyarchaeota archaeon]MDW8040000.1 bis-aminopropyl spermidine synthase family protein [Nitrososphaerota archaeon]